MKKFQNKGFQKIGKLYIKIGCSNTVLHKIGISLMFASKIQNNCVGHSFVSTLVVAGGKIQCKGFQMAGEGYLDSY